MRLNVSSCVALIRDTSDSPDFMAKGTTIRTETGLRDSLPSPDFATRCTSHVKHVGPGAYGRGIIAFDVIPTFLRFITGSSC